MRADLVMTIFKVTSKNGKGVQTVKCSFRRMEDVITLHANVDMSSALFVCLTGKTIIINV